MCKTDSTDFELYGWDATDRVLQGETDYNPYTGKPWDENENKEKEEKNNE